MLSDQAFEYEPDGKHHTEPMPADLEEEEHRVHDELVEEIVSGDDEQLERYLSGEVPSVAELEKALAHEVLEGKEFPVLLGSALTGVGIDRLADFICEIGPSPADRPVTVQAGDQEVSVNADPDGQPLAYVFRTIADPFVGQLSVFKVLSGTIKTDDHLVNATSGTDERLHGLFHLRGKDQTTATSLMAGDIAAVAKLAGTRTGDTLALKGSPVRVVASAPRRPSSAWRRPRTQADDDKLGGALQRLQAEDPALVVERNEETRQTLLRGVGETHLSVSLERLSRKFGVNVDTEDVRAVPGDDLRPGRGRGQGQEADRRAWPVRGRQPRVEPLAPARASPSWTPSSVAPSPASTSRPCRRGSRTRWPMVVSTGSRWSTSRCSATTASTTTSTRRRWPSAPRRPWGSRTLAKAGVVVLEPISLLTVRVPAAYQGDVMGDINSRRGRVQGTGSNNGESEVTALVPTAEILRYAIDLRSMTGGRGSFMATHDHYDVLPSHLIDKAKATLAANA